MTFQADPTLQNEDLLVGLELPYEGTGGTGSAGREIEKILPKRAEAEIPSVSATSIILHSESFFSADWHTFEVVAFVGSSG